MRVWVYLGHGACWGYIMCCNNFHIRIFSGCLLITAVGFSPILEFTRYIPVFFYFYFVPIFLYVLFFPNNWYQRFWFDYGISVLSMLCGCSFVWSSKSEKKGDVVKKLLSCNHKFCCAVWARENWWKNCFWLVESSSKICVDKIKITQDAILCRWLKSFLPTWKLHHKFSTWFSACENSWSGLASSEVYSSLGGVW